MEVRVQRRWSAAVAGFTLGALCVVGVRAGSVEAASFRQSVSLPAPEMSPAPGIDPATVRGVPSPASRRGAVAANAGPVSLRLLAVLVVLVLGFGTPWRIGSLPSPGAWRQPPRRRAAAGRAPPGMAPA